MTRPLTPEGAAAECAALLAAVATANGNIRRAAAAIGIPRRTLDRRIVALGLREQITTTYPRGARQPKR